MLVLYASETGTAQNLAKEFGNEIKRRDVRVKVCACDDYDFEQLPNESSVTIFAATCGQGDVPENAKEFWHYLTLVMTKMMKSGRQLLLNGSQIFAISCNSQSHL